MKSTFNLELTKAGIPKRLTYSCPRELSDVVRMATGGCATFRNGRWGMPVDPTYLRRLLPLTGARVTDTLKDYLGYLKRQQIQVVEAVKDGSPLGPDDGLWGPIQRASVRFLEAGGRVVLGHEMGVGKTVIACKALEQIPTSRILIVCPNSVKWSWVDHIAEWAHLEYPVLVMESGGKSNEELRPKKNAHELYGSKTERDNQLSTMIAEKQSFALIMNYEQMAIHSKIFAESEYDVIIVDEAHRVKNRKAKRTKALIDLSKRSAYFWLLTGTPVRNSHADVWTLLNMCDPIRFGSYWNFVKTYMLTVNNYFGGIDITGLIDEAEFNTMLSRYMYRKTKKEALPELPDKIYFDHKLALNPEQAGAYQTMEDEFILHIRKELEDGAIMEELLSAPTTVAQLIRLRQICLTPALLGGVADSAKLDALNDVVQDLIYDNQKFIIYTAFRAFIPFVEVILQGLKVPYGIIRGGQKSEERARLQDSLTHGMLQAIVGTTSAMGEGMNLQAATTAIFLDIDWVPAVNQQAEDRLHRAGIKKSPTIIRLYHPGTVEEDIRLTCSRKERIIDETVGQVEVMRNMLLRQSKR